MEYWGDVIYGWSLRGKRYCVSYFLSDFFANVQIVFLISKYQEEIKIFSSIFIEKIYWWQKIRFFKKIFPLLKKGFSSCVSKCVKQKSPIEISKKCKLVKNCIPCMGTCRLMKINSTIVVWVPYSLSCMYYRQKSIVLSQINKAMFFIKFVQYRDDGGGIS